MKIRETYDLKRRIPVEDGYDVVVAGGGPAGASAAISAARLGARVLLIEGTGCMGGMGTSGLVTAFDPMANGEEMLVGGLMREIVETLYTRGELAPDIDPDTWRKHYTRWTPFRVEGYKRLLDELATASGVEVRFFTRLIDCDADASAGRMNGAIINNVEGYSYIRARTFIDATGDAVLAHLAGAACREAGRDTPNIMPATLPSLFAGSFRKANTDDNFWKRQNDALLRAIADGHFSQPDNHLPGLSMVANHVGYLNGGHIYNLNALRVKSLSEGVMFGRKIAKEYLDFYRKYVPGCEDLDHVTTASLIGVRESRRIVGEYELNVQDYLAARHFPDQIGLFNKFIDIHPYDSSEAEWNRFIEEKADPKWKLPPGKSFGIPYSILVPKGWKNLWVAGRCASADIQVHGVIRVQPACSMMGQAAGTAAVQSIRHGQTAANLDTAQLVATLREAGANLPQSTLSPEMTRSCEKNESIPLNTNPQS